MKPKGTKRIFRCLTETHRLRYSELYGAADSKSHRQVKDVYSNAGTELTKQGCIGHVQKRVRTGLRKLKMKHLGWEEKANYRQIAKLTWHCNSEQCRKRGGNEASTPSKPIPFYLQ